MYYELTLELHGEDDEEVASAVARGLAKDHACQVNVTRVDPGRTLADKEKRELVKTVRYGA